LFDSENELAPDLEWMLSSTQASPALIIEAAAQEYGAQIYLLGLAMLDDGEQARLALEDSLAALVKHRRAYQCSMDLRKWILARALEVCRKRLADGSTRAKVSIDPSTTSEPGLRRAFYSLPLQERMLLALNLLLEMELSQAGALLQVSPSEARQLLKSAVERLEGQGASSVKAAPLPLAQRLRACFGGMKPDQHVLDAAAAGAINNLEKRARRQRWLVVLQPVAMLTLILAFVLLESWWSRRSDLPVPSMPAATVTAMPAFVTSTPPGSADWQTLSGYFSGDQPWRRLWLEALTIHYGPPGYIGPAHTWRNQLWLQFDQSNTTQPALQRLVYSGPSEQPEYVVEIKEGRLALLDLSKNAALRLSARQADYFRTIQTASAALGNPGEVASLANLTGETLLKSLTGGSLLAQSGRLRLLGYEQALGRELQVIEQAPLSAEIGSQMTFQRAWVDQESGMVLRWQLYTQGETPLLLEEMVVKALMLDGDILMHDLEANLPATGAPSWESLRPSGSELSFAMPFRPALPRLRLLERLPPPEGTDLTRLKLTSQWPAAEMKGEVELFAGGYYLGNIALGDVNPPSAFQVTCRRSADGRRVAFSRSASSLFFAEGGLFWLDLGNITDQRPLEVYPVLRLPDRVGRDFAWSPDGRRLAYWACPGDQQDCAVMLYNPLTNQNTRLANASYGAVNFTWHPGSELLAFVRLEADPYTNPSAWVMDVKQARLLQERSYTWRLPHPLDSPSGEWWLPPYQPVGLEGCLGE
jgi:DNA-directed RNA polymerase specialized sigma24 family protein